MKRIAILLSAVLSLGAIFHASAQGNSDAKQLATEVVELTASDSMMQSIRQSMAPVFANMSKQFGDKNMNSKQQEILKRFADETMTYMMGPEYLGKVRTATIDAYASVFTTEELKGIRDFYRSPAGVAFIKKMPDTIGYVMPSMQAAMQPMMDRMKERTARLAAEIKAAE